MVANMKLSSEQYKIVNNIYNQRIMIVQAPPGTGKTFTAVNAANKFIENQIISKNKMIKKVLILTFSKNARAQIIKQRRNLKDDKYNFDKYIEITNYHSFYKKYIDSYSNYLGLGNNLRLISEMTRRKQIRCILNDLGVSLIKDSQIDWAMDLLDGDYIPSNKIKKKQVQQIYYLKDKIISKIIQSNREGNIYFSDFAYYMKLLLLKSPKLLSIINEKYQLIILDEYQDSSDIQEEIVKLLVGNKNRALFFADTNQMIYEWRGATSKRIENIKEYYQNEVKVINLTQVYRYKGKDDIMSLVNSIVNGEYNIQNRISTSNIKYTNIPVNGTINFYNPKIKNKCFSDMKYTVYNILRNKKSDSIGVLTRDNELLIYLKNSLKKDFNLELKLMCNNENEHLIVEEIGRYIENNNFEIDNNVKLLINILDAISEEKKFGSFDLRKKEEYTYNLIRKARVEVIKRICTASENIYDVSSFQQQVIEYIQYLFNSSILINNDMYYLIKSIVGIKKLNAKNIDSIFIQYQTAKSFINLKGRYILNVHQSKGREFDTVIILDSNRIAKEKNLFYVAVSRARKEIIMVDWIES